MIKKIFVNLSFGILLFLSIAPSGSKGYLLIPVGFVIGAVFMLLLKVVLRTFNSRLVKKSGSSVISVSVTQGFLLMVPFVLLSFLSWRLFQWNSASSFTAAGVMICGSGAGMEIIKLGGDRKVNAIIPGLISAAMSLGWIYFVSIIQQGGVFK